MIDIHLHVELLQLVRSERRFTSNILSLLQEVENNRSYLDWGYSSLYAYLVHGLGYSEALAYQRKAALKICQSVPEVKEQLDRGGISLTVLARANKVLRTKSTSEKRSLLVELENKSTREVDQILAREWTGEIPGPAKRCATSSSVQVTLDFTAEEFRNFERLRALKSHQVTELKDLVNLLVEKELEKYNRTSKLSSRSERPRQIKASLKNHLLQKARYQCQYPGCEEKQFLQVDHIRPVAAGGGNKASNLQVLCRRHNLLKN